MVKFRLLDLFSGIGGFSLGLERSGGFRTVAFCEIEPYCRRVLAKHWPEVPCYHDIRKLTAERLAADGIEVDAICGGFPCQDISVAGRGAGLAGERSGLWREYARLIGEIRPEYIVVENVAALLVRGLGDVLADLAALGYDAEWHGVRASTVGAPHERDRIWIIAYPEQARLPRPVLVGSGLCGSEGAASTEFGDRFISCGPKWPELSEYLRMGDGIPRPTHAIGALGNAVVPQIPEMIGRAIMEASHAN